MKILLLGDYSNVHATLAEGLRALGHTVVVASDGDGWKNYPRDIDLRRLGQVGSHTLRQRLLDAAYMLRLHWLFATRFRGFDVVQLVNPIFLPLRAERIMPFYRRLRRHNRSVFMAAYGMDHYWVRAGLDCETFRYSDFNFGAHVRTELPENAIFVSEWLDGPKGKLNRIIAVDCDGIPAGLYEYWASYRKYLPAEAQAKLEYIAFPIRILPHPVSECGEQNKDESTVAPVRFFIGIQRSRSAYKGTDIMLRALERVRRKYPEAVSVSKVENVPFAEYKRLMDSSDVILDQLYSYTPAMNALQAMSQGLVVVGGAEPEYYDLQGADSEHRPIINVLPTEDDVFDRLCWIVEHRDQLPRLRQESRDFIARHHDHLKVAACYLRFWEAKAPGGFPQSTSTAEPREELG